MRAFMVCRNFSATGGMLARNGIAQGLPASTKTKRNRHGWSVTSDDSCESRDSATSSSSYTSRSSAASSVIQATPALGPRKMTQCTGQDLKRATSALDYARVHNMLEHSFETISVGEYSWLAELRLLGYSTSEITDELLAKSRDSPWIYSEFMVPNVGMFHQGLHMKGCVHGDKADSHEVILVHQNRLVDGDTTHRDLNGTEFSVRDSIEYLCGLSGVRPAENGNRELEFGQVFFENDNTLAIICLSKSESSEVSVPVLQNLSKSVAILQQAGGCCDSFTFLARSGSWVELQKVDLRLIATLAESLSSSEWHTPSLNLHALVGDLMGSLKMGFAFYEDGNGQLLYCLLTQLLSLSFLSYSQGHCGAIRPFYLDTPLQQILLLGNGEWSENFQGPCILGSLVELTCFGDMLQQPVFAFSYIERFDKALLVGSSPELKFDVMASPEDLLDTWGPGGFLASRDDRESLYAISIGGGFITPTSNTDEGRVPVLHWSRGLNHDMAFSSFFSRTAKILIGAMISANDKCDAKPQSQLRMAVSLLEELGTFPSYWEVSERQLGLGLQANAVSLLQFNQTWIKRTGLTKKSKILAQNSLYLADLEGPFGVQVSVCTGIARRVRLRDLLADVLPAYVGALVTKPLHWKTLVEDFDVLGALRDGDMNAWLGKLDHHLQTAFESLAVAVLFLLQNTGVDRKGQNFVIGCIQPDLPFQCFKVSCRGENYWTRMVADSEDIAAFAYMTAQCLETASVKCRGLGASWANSTALFWTAVSCYHEDVAESQVSVPQPAPQWSLKHSEAYLIGRLESPLLVLVDRPVEDEEPRLLVSVSTIRPEFLRRFYRKARRPRRLRERRTFDQVAESVVVLANQGG